MIVSKLFFCPIFCIKPYLIRRSFVLTRILIGIVISSNAEILIVCAIVSLLVMFNHLLLFLNKIADKAYFLFSIPKFVHKTNSLA